MLSMVSFGATTTLLLPQFSKSQMTDKYRWRYVSSSGFGTGSSNSKAAALEGMQFGESEGACRGELYEDGVLIFSFLVGDCTRETTDPEPTQTAPSATLTKSRAPLYAAIGVGLLAVGGLAFVIGRR